MLENEERQKNVMEAWSYKTDELKKSNEILSDSLNEAINQEINDSLTDIRRESYNLIENIKTHTNEAMEVIRDSSTQFADDSIQERNKALKGFETEYEALLNRLENQAAEMNQAYKEGLERLDQTTHDIVEKQKRNNNIFENGKFIFSNLIMVVLGVVLLRALFFGVWEGLFISNFYEWGSQWDWLKYTLWGLFAIIIGGIGYYIYLFLKNNLDR